MDNHSKELDSVNLATNRPNCGRGSGYGRQLNPSPPPRGSWNPYAINPRENFSNTPAAPPRFRQKCTSSILHEYSFSISYKQLFCLSTLLKRVGTANIDRQSANIATTNIVKDPAWYPDSGATSNCTADANNFTQKDSYFGNEQVHMGDGAEISISNVGKTSFTMPYSSKPLFLNLILHVPQITKKLISISKFSTDNNAYFEFFPDHCFVKDQVSKEVLLQGHLNQGLYVIHPSQNASFSSNSISYFSE
ncbi:uncharacterized protein LOC133033878 [Cannabis sativa]|uniref:uncharacterized protein LOC133033878 n=1 Tax=Cannabis sativa TaxID=3483 RepID=UPI0029CA72E1|nr:uncharacterized protein LOC133033878 [Cannabis sativa]